MSDNELIKLDLGAGGNPAPGFISIDRKNGQEVYPLDYPDESVDEIRASHVLEHFSHTHVMEVVHHWVSKLKPGGRLRIAVPDFEFIAREYLAGHAVNVQGFLMGGHVDENDHHGTAFDGEVLEEVLLAAGLERLHRWDSEMEDCATLPVSLNMGGFKPSGQQMECRNTTAILSAPRFGPVLHFRCALSAFSRARVPYQIAGGAYWHQVISDLLEAQIADPATRYVITCDYDTVFGYEDVLELYRLMEAVPEADAICGLQSKRGCDQALFGIRRDDGSHVTSLPEYQLSRHLLPISVGHFGLTIFRAESLRQHPRPWMQATPNTDGKWSDGKVDADIEFWHNWLREGRSLYLAPRVVLGHMQEMITWPGQDLKPIYQTAADYDNGGMPKGAIR